MNFIYNNRIFYIKSTTDYVYYINTAYTLIFMLMKKQYHIKHILKEII
ncbi:protein of unknown function [Clostridium beijerinckii]|nr:protein of unknown function [Clostridium beijerinckii]